jgi:integrase
MTDKLVKSLRHFQHQAINEQLTPFINGYVFVNSNTGLPFSDIRRAWSRLLRFANLPKMRLHDIQHLIGTYSINELNLSVEMVSHTLGHSDITITQRCINPKPENSKTVISSLFESVETDPFIEQLDNDFAIADTTKKLHSLLVRSCGGNYKVAVC